MGPVLLIGWPARGTARPAFHPVGGNPGGATMPDRRHSRRSARLSRIGVMHLVDSLDIGGAETVAVNLVNCLPREQYVAHLCTTRKDGPLEKLVRADVLRLGLQRKY